MGTKGRTFAKSVLFICALLLLAIGVVGLFFGIKILTGKTSLQADLNFVVACGSLYIVGGVCVLFGIALGTLGALRDSKVLLLIFLTPMIIAFVSIVITRILMNDVKKPETTRKWLETTLDNYKNVDVDREFWNNLQRNYKCCGIDGYGDWESNGISLPESCCQKNPSDYQDENEFCIAFGKELNYVYENGCHKELVDAQDLFCFNSFFVEIAFYVCWLAAVGAVCGILYDISPNSFRIFH